MVSYLLGEMSEDKQARFEDRYFADDELFEQMVIVKEELIDAYVRGHLDRRERERFERNFLNSPERREQVAFAQALRQKLSGLGAEAPASAPTPSSWRAWFDWRPPRVWGWAAAAALLLVAGMGWGLSRQIRENRSLRDELAALRAEQAERLRQQEQLERQLAELRAQTSTGNVSPSPPPDVAPSPRATPDEQQSLLKTIPAFVLMPTRGDTGKADLPLTARYLRLHLVIVHDPKSRPHTAVLRSANGKPIERRSRLRAQSEKGVLFVEAVFSAASLEAGEYSVTLTASGGKGQPKRSDQYRFEIVRN